MTWSLFSLLHVFGVLNSDDVWYIGDKLLLLNGVVGGVLCVLLIWGLQSHRVQRITPALVFIPISVLLSLDVLLSSQFDLCKPNSNI